jgi:hypothetical protein
MNSTSPSPRCIFRVLFLSLLLAGTTFAQGTVPKFLFVANYIDGTISVFQVQALTGQLTQVPGSPFAGGAAIQGIALTPYKRFLCTSGNSVTAFNVNQQNGTLTQIAAYPLVDGSGRLIITPDGKFAYSMGNGIFAFSIDSATGTLTAVPGSPWVEALLEHVEAFDAAGCNPQRLTVAPPQQPPGCVSCFNSPVAKFMRQKIQLISLAARTQSSRRHLDRRRLCTSLPADTGTEAASSSRAFGPGLRTSTQ